LNRTVIVAAAVTMPSARNVRKGRRYLGKRMALLACKLDGRGTVVDEVVVLGNGVVDSSVGVYRRIKGGGNNKYTTIIAIQMQDIADTKQRSSNAVLSIFRRSGNLSGDDSSVPGDYRTDDPEGKVPCLRCRGHRTNIRRVYPC